MITRRVGRRFLKAIILGYQIRVTDVNGHEVKKIGDTTIKSIVDLRGRQQLMPLEIAEFIARCIVEMSEINDIECHVQVVPVVFT